MRVSIRYIFGRSGTGKTRFIYNDIKQKIREKSGKPLILIVPEQFNFQAHKDLIKVLDEKGIMDVEILSFQRLAHRVFEEVGGPHEKLLGDLGRNMVLRKVIDGMEEKLQILNKSVKQPGFMQTLGNIISEFQQYDIAPETLSESKDNVKSTILKEKLNDLCLVFQGFKNYMKEKYITSEEILDVLANKIESCSFLEGAHIWIDGFYGFTPQQYRIIYQLLKKAEIMHISLTLDPDVDLFLPCDEGDPFCESRRTFDKLNKITALYNVKLEEPVKLFNKNNTSGKNVELIHLEKEYFNYPCKPYEKETEYIRLYIATNPYNEIEQVAKNILDFVQHKGYRYRDIAVVTGAISKYQKIIEGIFKEYNIPYFIDMKQGILSHPFVELIRASLEIIINNWSYESMFRYLKTRFTGIDEEEIDILENYVLAYGIKGVNQWTKKDWEKKTLDDLDDVIKKEYEESLLERINQTRKQVAEPLLVFHQKLKSKQKQSVREITTILYEFIEDLGIKERLQEHINHFMETNQLILAKQNVQIWDLIMELLDKQVEILGDEEVTIKEYAKILDAGLEQCQMGLVPPALDQVVVADLERSRLPHIKALIVIGINDGILPAATEELGIFSDEERGEMSQMGLELAPDGRRRAFEEQFLIYSGLTKPEQYLQLSFSMGDEEGKALRPSVIVSRIKKIFPHIYEISDLQNSKEEYISAPVPTFHYLGLELRDILEKGGLCDTWKDVYSWYLSQADWKDKTRITVKGLFHTNQENYLTAKSVKTLYGNKIYSSVSRLEKFAACPFGYFVEYGLKAKERRIYQLQTPDLGRLFHSALDIFSQKLQTRGIAWKNLDQDTSNTLIEQTMDEIAPKLGHEILLSTARNKYLLVRLKRITKRAVWALTEHIKRGNFEPLGFEVGFGEHYKLPPIVVELKTGEKIILTGRIDRVDILDENNKAYIKIIDYKSGNRTFNLADIFYGIQLQLLLYLDAFLENGKEILHQELFPAGVFYFRIDDPLIRSAKEMSEEELEKLLLKNLKLSGMVLEDLDVVKKMDNTLQRYSDILPVTLTKNGFDTRSSTATLEEFNILRNYVRNIVAEIGEEILKGNVKVSPYKSGKNTSCNYCLYRSVCQFDTLLEDNQYRILKNLKKEDIWQQLKQDK